MIVPAIRSVVLAALLAFPLAAANNATRHNASQDVPTQHNEATVAQLQAEMASGQLTSVELTKEYIKRIVALDQNGPGVNAVIELNPDALEMARNADFLRKRGILLGPLHGIPVLLKDNVDTGDSMQTSAGSFALVGKPALHDSTVAANLRAGGAVILGKTNLSEWANFRSFESVSGWSGRGGQTNNPYGINRNPCGSSSGSGAAELCRRVVRYGDGRQHRLPRQREWCRRPQADGGPHQPCWHRADLPHAGYFWSARAHRS
jgi:amidase